jgi:hydroxymethylbilane synthase
VETLGGGCQLPLGAVATLVGNTLDMQGIVTSLDGRRVVRREATGPANDAAAVGRRLADALARGGATAILDEVRGAQGPVAGSY